MRVTRPGHAGELTASKLDLRGIGRAPEEVTGQREGENEKGMQMRGREGEGWKRREG